MKWVHADKFDKQENPVESNTEDEDYIEPSDKAFIM